MLLQRRGPIPLQIDIAFACDPEPAFYVFYTHLGMEAAGPFTTEREARTFRRKLIVDGART